MWWNGFGGQQDVEKRAGGMTKEFDRRFEVAGRGLVFDYGKAGLRRDSDTARISAIKAAAVPLAACGPAVHAAPARGYVRVTNPVGLIPTGANEWKAEFTAFRGRSVQVVGDVFDAMNARAAAKGGDLFTEGQMWVARRYRALVEGRAVGGVKCSSIGGSGGGEGARDFMDHYIADGEALALLIARIGVGAAMVVRRVRPSARGEDRAMLIRDRALVDMICLRDMTPSVVLKRHGWGDDGKHRKMIKVALVGVLDRMQGLPLAGDAK